MKIEKSITRNLFFFFILFFAFLVRFLKLGDLPLSDFEARIALHSSQLLNGNNGYLSSDVFLVNFNAFFIYLFGNSNLIVRLFSAIIGFIFVFTPFLFRKVTDSKILFVISIWMAIDPLLISLSRQINSALICLFFGVLLFFFILQKNEIAIGIISAILLLCGPVFWFGIFPLLLMIIYKVLRKSKFKDNGIFPFQDSFHIKKFFISFFIALILISSFGFVFRTQFIGIIQGFFDYFQGWRLISQSNLMDTIRGMVIYEFPLIGFGLIGVIVARRMNNSYLNFIVVWLLLSIVHFLIYPQNSIVNLVWIVIPLILFGSIFIQKFTIFPGKNSRVIILISLIGFVLLEFLTLISINLLTNAAAIGQSPISKTVMVIAGIVLVFFAIFLVGWSLSWKIAGKSLLLIFVVYFSIYTLSTGWNAAGLRSPFENEMLNINPIPISGEILVSTIGNYSEWNHGSKLEGHIQVVNIDYPGLKWALRDFKNVEYEDNFSINSNPEFVITKSDQTIEATDSFKGQDFIWVSKPIWNLFLPNEWANWILSRRIPTNLQQQDAIILWVRNDLFPGN